jgi:ABC-type transport system involved in cytochrome c biogenesis permease component
MSEAVLHDSDTSEVDGPRVEQQTTDPDWLQRIDNWCERIGDGLNPILVKETRQALKSRQFVITFSVLLFAALAWTIVGSLSMMPTIYTSPSAPRMLIGYYLVLALPMLLVVPLAAYRSLEGEIDDGTLELLSITTLGAWQIVLGKMASAMLQMLLYFVALFPCVAYAYTLRGVDLPTTFLMMAIVLVAAIMLTVISLFFAPLAQSRTGRISTLLAVMLVLLIAEWGIAALVISMILYGNPLSFEWQFFLVTATLLISISLGHLLLTATAAQLTPESENRSTHIRLSLLVFSAIIFTLCMLAVQTLGSPGVAAAQVLLIMLTILWTLASAMMTAESAVMTPRVRRELPNSFLARCFLTWLTPGPSTGLIFSGACIAAMTIFVIFGIDFAYDQPNVNLSRRRIEIQKWTCIAYSGYLVGFLLLVYLVVRIIRIKNHPRVEFGIAALVAVAVIVGLFPYSVGLHLNDYRSFSYSSWQITNWAWTLYEIRIGADMRFEIAIMVILVTIGFFACLLLSPKLVRPRREATPERVQQELETNTQ